MGTDSLSGMHCRAIGSTNGDKHRCIEINQGDGWKEYPDKNSDSGHLGSSETQDKLRTVHVPENREDIANWDAWQIKREPWLPADLTSGSLLRAS